jgi:hypothetical protein
MTTLATMIAENPEARIPRGMLRRSRSSRSVVVIYSTPDEETGHFTNQAFSAPRAPPAVVEALREAQRRYHASFWDKRTYREAIARCTTNGRFNRARFLALPNRHKFISLIGYVSATRQAAFASDIRRCLAFDERFSRTLDDCTLGKQDRAWLNFRAVAAYPIESRGHGARHADVLLVLTNVPRGLSEVDRLTIRAVKRLLASLPKNEESRPRIERLSDTSKL